MSSNTIFDAALANELALLERELDTPAAPYGYGTDLSCVDDLAADWGEVDPSSRRALAESLVRRFLTPRGSVLDAPNDGYDLRQHLNRGQTPRELARIVENMRAEARKDDRVTDTRVTLDYVESTSTLTVRMAVEAVDPAIGIFSLTFAVTADGSELLESIQ